MYCSGAGSPAVAPTMVVHSIAPLCSNVRPLSATVDWRADGVDDPAEHGVADRDVDDPARPLDRVAFLDVDVGTEDGAADVVFLEVEHHAHDAFGEFDQLARHHVLQAVDAGDPIA